MTSSSSRALRTTCLLAGIAVAGCTGAVEPIASGSGAGNGSAGMFGGAGASGSRPDGGVQPGTGGGPVNPGGTGGGQPGSGGGVGSGGTGGIVNPGSGGTGGPTACETSTTRRLRRLSVREFANVVSDLLGASAKPMVLTGLAPEDLFGGFDHQSERLYVSSSFHDAVARLAEALATQANPATLAPCSTAAGSPACLQTFIRTFASKAFGRPLTDPEVSRISTVAATGENYATSVRLVVELVLQSPHFLYLSELGAADLPPAPQKAVPLTPHEIASQLSFMLTGTRPDAKLLTAAQTTGFARPEDLRAEAERLLLTPAAPGELARFISGWMDMAPVADAPKDPDYFPAFTAPVMTAMQQEFDQFVNTNLKGGDGTLAALMSQQSTNIPAALAPIYGTDLKAGVLDATRRRGLLSLPAVLTHHASDKHSNPVERGLFVRQQLLCSPVPGPPDSVLQRNAANPLDADDPTRTTRQKFEQHLDDMSCSQCHQFFDPIGFGFEQMDGIGRFRTTENGKAVDSKGELTSTDVDGPFEGPAQLSTMLARSKKFEACMVDRFFQFAHSRPSTTADQCVIGDWTTKFAASGGRIKELVFSAVTHRTFTTRKDDR